MGPNRSMGNRQTANLHDTGLPRPIVKGIIYISHSHPIRPEPIMQAGGMERVSD